LFKFIWEPGRYGGFRSNPLSFPPLTIGNILLGSGWVPIYLWLWWSWQPRRKHARWHRWLASLAAGIYLTVLILLGGISSWNTLLIHPFNMAVNGILILLLVMSWILPVFSYQWAKKLADVQDELGIRMLGCGGVGSLLVMAGILGASYGMSASRHGRVETAALIMAFAWPLVSFFVAQYNAVRLWRCRPWEKEAE
jgi:hypothetical protein